MNVLHRESDLLVSSRIKVNRNCGSKRGHTWTDTLYEVLVYLKNWFELVFHSQYHSMAFVKCCFNYCSSHVGPTSPPPLPQSCSNICCAFLCQVFASSHDDAAPASGPDAYCIPARSGICAYSRYDFFIEDS